MNFLGVHFCGHDSNFTYTKDKKIHYYKAERYKQIKHHEFSELEFLDDVKRFNIDLTSLDAVCITGFFIGQDEKTIAYKIIDKSLIPYLSQAVKCPIYCINHHYAHSLSCFPLENYEKISKSFVLDGSGDVFNLEKYDAEIVTVFKKKDVLEKYSLPNLSIGRALKMLGKLWQMQGHKDDFAGKLMSYQSYGKIDNETIERFKYHNLKQIEDIFLNAPKSADVDWIRNRHIICERLVKEFFMQFSNSNEVISYSGGVAQNIVINTHLKHWNKNIIIPPHSGDEGLSLGCVEFLRNTYEQEFFDTTGFPYWQEDEVKEMPSSETIKKAANLIAKGNIIGWCQGKGEVGPRALGNRSILMRADIKGGKDFINKQVKFREEYRPFGCSVLLEDIDKHLNNTFESPYMLYTMDVKDKSSFESVTHIDGTTRPQTVKDGAFAELLYEVKKLIGHSLILNTSLNVNGKPITTPENAKNIKGLNALFIGNDYV